MSKTTPTSPTHLIRAAAFGLAMTIGAAHAQLSPPPPASAPSPERDLSGGKKMPQTGLIDKKNAASAPASQGKTSTANKGATNMPGGIGTGTERGEKNRAGTK